MLCHECGEPAIGQCKLCRQFFCARHGRLYCYHCRHQEQIAATVPTQAQPQQEEGISATPTQEKEPASVEGPCHCCGQPASRRCLLCGQLFCNAHRGWREVRIGRYKMRRPVCSSCAGTTSWLSLPTPRWLSLQLKWLLLWLLIGFLIWMWWGQ